MNPLRIRTTNLKDSPFLPPGTVYMKIVPNGMIIKWITSKLQTLWSNLDEKYEKNEPFPIPIPLKSFYWNNLQDLEQLQSDFQQTSEQAEKALCLQNIRRKKNKRQLAIITAQSKAMKQRTLMHLKA